MSGGSTGDSDQSS